MPAGMNINSNYTGLWWAAPSGSDSGRGINLAHQGDVIFLTWFTYDTTGKAWWLSMTAEKIDDNVYDGPLFEARGPAFNAVPFSSVAVTHSTVGFGILDFRDTENRIFSYSVNGEEGYKRITRQVFGPLPTCTWGALTDLTAATNFQGLWWAAPAESESGWGVYLTQQGTTIFATWLTYDANHSPLWLSATARQTAPNTYSGALDQTSKTAFGAQSITHDPAGTATFTFSDGNTGTFAYNVDLHEGVNKASQTKPITRQVFRPPGTVCQ